MTSSHPPRLASLGPRSLLARSRAIQVLGDIRRDPTLTFSQAAENRGVDPSTIHKYISSELHRDKSGRIKAARPSDRLRETMYIPSTRPGESIPVKTKSTKERKLVGQYHAVLNDARNGDYTTRRDFIAKHGNSPFVGGVRLSTGAHQIQRLLEALEATDAKFEGPYKAFTARVA